jgi:hypothetical protein
MKKNETGDKPTRQITISKKKKKKKTVQELPVETALAEAERTRRAGLRDGVGLNVATRGRADCGRTCKGTNHLICSRYKREKYVNIFPKQ